MRSAAPSETSRPSWIALVGLLVVFVVAGIALYAPVLEAPFFSDDFLYTSGNPYLINPSFEGLVEILNPLGDANKVVSNYSPVVLLLHLGNWWAFGDNLVGHHLVNVVVHAVVAMLLVLLLMRAGISRGLAVFGGLFFLLHPANVESVAWVSQLKTTASTALAFAALLWTERRPLPATIAFALALLTKATAAFALPVAILWLWTRPEAERSAQKQRVLWLGAWLVLLLAFALMEGLAFDRALGHLEASHVSLLVAVRTTFSLAGRYLVMAATSYGVSAFHEPPPAVSWLDPWWLIGLVGFLGIGSHALRSLVRRREDAAWWAWAVVAFIPVSQILPFPYPFADRYLYTILPGILGGVLIAVDAVLRSFEGANQQTAKRVATALGAVALLGITMHASTRTAIWSDPERIQADAAMNYPDGTLAALYASRQSAIRGDVETAVAQLRRAHSRGFINMSAIFQDPAYAEISRSPAFQLVIREMAQSWIVRYSSQTDLSQDELLSLAAAHQIRGEMGPVRDLFQRALEVGGPMDDWIRSQLQIPTDVAPN